MLPFYDNFWLLQQFQCFFLHIKLPVFQTILSGILLAFIRTFYIIKFITEEMQRSILIVEDEKMVREGLVRALSNTYKTYQASNGKEALEMINENSDIRVIVSDMKMPEIDGFEMLDNIQKLPNKISVIFVTAFYSVESAVDAMKKGAFEYMTKPVDLKKLESVIQSAITGKGIRG